MNGQLWPKEREFLHKCILDHAPEVVLEVGTWKGGGSTYQIVQALEKNGKGILYTCEPNLEFYKEAALIYQGNKYINMNNENSEILIARMIDENMVPDFLFFDGPETEDTALTDLLKLEPYLKIGSHYSMHDFDPPSIKAKMARPYLENSSSWKLISKLTRPESVGICLWEKIKY